ncbi:MAG: hypothetical protein KJZ47_07230 [Gemmatimonadales bacterium]|nr:hypothetical protein [Gemmatimonadales bacterium]
MRQGDGFRGTLPGGWILKLIPSASGWSIQVALRGRELEDLSKLTPPWHFVPNPRELGGWHFRNRDNTAPNDGSVNAPPSLREFIFSPEVGRTLVYRGSATSEADIETVRSFGRGWLNLEAFALTPPQPGARAAFIWLRFTACLTWPTEFRQPPRGSVGTSRRPRRGAGRSSTGEWNGAVVEVRRY